MTATLTVRHTVADYETWLVAYKEAGAIRSKYGCTGDRVYRLPANSNDVFITHDFPTLSQAEGFAGDSELRVAMESGGVTSAPRIEIFELV